MLTRARNVKGRFLPSKPLDVRTSPQAKEAEKLIKIGPITFILIHADWCGHCQKVKPDWTTAAKEINTKDDKKMIMVNCGEGTDEDQKIMKNYNIDGYPTIIKFVNGTPSLYRGDRDADSFKDIFA
jgi:thiol:disulfide interchange protein